MNDPYENYKILDCNPQFIWERYFLIPPEALDKVWHQGLNFNKKAYGLYGNLLKLLEKYFKHTLKTFGDFKNKQKISWSKVFDICKIIYILEICSIPYTLRQNTNASKICLGQNERHKKLHTFFFCEFQVIITVSFLVHDSYNSWSANFVSLKMCMGFSIFDCVSFSLSIFFRLKQAMGSLTSKRHNSFQN